MPERKFLWDGGGVIVSGLEEELVRMADGFRTGNSFSGAGLTFKFVRSDDSLDPKKWKGVAFETSRQAKDALQEALAREVGFEMTDHYGWLECLEHLRMVKGKAARLDATDKKAAGEVEAAVRQAKVQ